jgi:hypothetical protein
MSQPWEPQDTALSPAEQMRMAEYMFALQDADGSTDASLEADFLAWMHEDRYPRRSEEWIQAQARKCRDAGLAARRKRQERPGRA